MSQVKKIYKFENVKIIPKSLVVIDIDDTIVKSDSKFYLKCKEMYNDLIKIMDAKTATQKLIEECMNYVKNTNPIITDEYIPIFINNCIMNDCEVIFLTARHEETKDATQLQLEKLNIKVKSDSLHFGQNKGIKLREILNKKDVKSVIFIDDLDMNFRDILNEFNDSRYELNLYKFTSS
jgi:hypothetical protein